MLCLDLYLRANVEWIHRQATLNLLEESGYVYLLNLCIKELTCGDELDSDMLSI